MSNWISQEAFERARKEWMAEPGEFIWINPDAHVTTTSHADKPSRIADDFSAIARRQRELYPDGIV